METKVTYQIRINGANYEGSGNLEEAKSLYRTVDATCLEYCKGKTKSLVKILNGKEEVLRTDTIY